MNHPTEHAQQSPLRVVTRSVIAGSDAGAFRVLTIEQAAEFLHLNSKTLQRKARTGEIPAAKPGRRWIFIEIDLVDYLRAQYSSRVMQGAHEEVKLCRSTNAVIFGITSCTTAEKSYKKALGLPTR